jgi:asparagine synthase (glutamine-hydrolysing)
MNQSQLHRGPDESGLYIEDGIALAHQRLSIIDLSSGQQPMRTPDGRYILVYNGEIYNFRELAETLKAKGHNFLTRCDTEVILHAYAEWGEACVNHFRGMFAFALYDTTAQTLFLARDRLGIKPLFYALTGQGQLLFGSELKALKAHPQLPRTLDPKAVEDYFCLGYIPEPRTIYNGVYKLNPGHTLTVTRHKPLPSPVEYWDVPFSPVGVSSEEQLIEELQHRLREAVDIRLVSEVPLGAFLSGGVDSSAVVATMAELQSSPVNTCAIGFDVAQFDETDFARQVAERYNTNHLEKTVSADNFDLLDTLASLYDEPYADSSAIPTYRVCQLAREQVTVALSGDGGDEGFAGYRRYRWHMNEERLRAPMPLSVRRPIFGALGRLYPKLDWAPRFLRAKTTFESLAKDSVDAYLHSVSLTSEEQRRQLFSPQMHSALQGYGAADTFHRHAERSPTDDPLSIIQYLDMKTYLVGDILTKVDRASMAHSLEVRVPLLDHKLIEWVSGLPVDYKLRGQEGKYILKKAMESKLPHDVLYRPKMGFGVPLGKWFRGPLRRRLRESLLGGELAATGIFNQDYLQRLVDDHQSGLREYSAPLWSLLMFQASIRDDQFTLGQ